MTSKKYDRNIKWIGFFLLLTAVLLAGEGYSQERKAKVTVEQVNIYLHADKESPVIGIAKKDTLLSLQSNRPVKKIWYYIYFSSGEGKTRRSGYVLISEVHIVEVSPEMEEQVQPVEIVKPITVEPETKKPEKTKPEAIKPKKKDKKPKKKDRKPELPKLKKPVKIKDPRMETEKPKNHYFSIGVSYFFPAEERFKTVYGNAMVLDAELTFGIWKGLEVWAGGSYLSKKGELTYTKEETKLKITPLRGGLKYRIIKGKFNLYAGAGVGYYQLKESNPIGVVSKGGIGYLVKLGGFFSFGGKGLFEIYTEYSQCRIKPTDFTIDIGGLKVGLGFGWLF
jgi:hypothetical protein